MTEVSGRIAILQTVIPEGDSAEAVLDEGVSHLAGTNIPRPPVGAETIGLTTSAPSEPETTIKDSTSDADGPTGDAKPAEKESDPRRPATPSRRKKNRIPADEKPENSSSSVCRFSLRLRSWRNEDQYNAISQVVLEKFLRSSVQLMYRCESPGKMSDW
jgi:hypothetical protein